MNKILVEAIEKTRKGIVEWDNPSISFGAGLALGQIYKSVSECEEQIMKMGFLEAMEICEDLIMFGNYDFIKKMFPRDSEMELFDLVAKHGLMEVSTKFVEYKKAKGDKHEKI